MTPTDELADGAVRLYRGDAAEVLDALPDASVDLIATDPPYFGVKADEWDNQWDTADDYLAWVRGLCDRWLRVLRPNGSLYVFASPRMAARVECVVGGRFNVLNSITWQKDFPCGALKYGPENFRTYVEMSERVIFAGHPSATDCLRSARLAAGLKGTDVDVRMGYVRKKDPTRGTELFRRWEEGTAVPTPETYDRLRSFLDLPPYDDAFRPFTVSQNVPYSDVWVYKPVGQAALQHPCEKPLAMMRHIVRASSRPGAVVLDCFAGSGTTGVAAVQEGRQAVLVERDPAHYATALARLRHAAGEGSLFAGVKTRQPTLTGDD